jgi:putative ABC transport system ATP-binding protein
MTPGLVLDDVGLARREAAPVSALSVTAQPGNIVAIVGAVGSGKSSLLEAIGPHRRRDHGSVRLHGIDIADRRLAHRIATVSQDHALVATLTATENVMLTAMGTQIRPEDAWAYSRDHLDRLDLPRAAQSNLAEELSGGQHQRVALARALAGDPALLLADDPTSELDEVSVGRAIDALQLAARAGTIVVVASAEPRVADAAHIVLDLDAGSILQSNEAARTSPVPPFEPGDEVRITGASTRFPACIDVIAADVSGWIPASHLTQVAQGRAVVLLAFDPAETAAVDGRPDGGGDPPARVDRRNGLALTRRGWRPLERTD